MRSLGQISAILLGFTCTALPCGASAAPNELRPTSVSAEVTAVLRRQEQAWNKGDIEGFMNGYLHSNRIVFVSGDGVTRGWEIVRERYRRKYSDRAKMGTLRFSDLEISELGPGTTIALGRWELTRASDRPHGYFTLILRKTSAGWRIVHDHTSQAG